MPDLYLLRPAVRPSGMHHGPLVRAAGPVAVLAAALVGLASCGGAAEGRPPPSSGHPSLTVAPAPSRPPGSAVSAPVTGRSPATTAIAG